MDSPPRLGRDGRMDSDPPPDLDRIGRLEERVAHLLRAVDDLSDIVARQERELAVLGRRAAMLLEREAEREAQGMRDAPIERPPHW